MMSEPRLAGPAPLTFIPDVVYGTADSAEGAPLLLDMMAPLPAQGPTAKRPAVIWVHGGAWYSGTRRDHLEVTNCALLAAHGFIAASIEYRLSQDATFPAQIHDIKAAIRWLRANADTYGIDPQRLGIWGLSAGGQLAALAGVTGDVPELEGASGSPGHSSAVQAVAVASTPTFFLHPAEGRRTKVPPPTKALFGGTAAERADLMMLGSPLAQVRPNPPPFLIAHGTRDRTVAFEHAQRFHAALVAAGGEAQLIAVEGLHHNWLPQEGTPVPGREGVWQFGSLALPFFRRHLRPPTV